nr:hypothetical protein [Tanacetum cinerariifolium]
GEGLGTPIEPHNTPFSVALPPSPTTHSSPTLPPVTTTSIPTVTPSETTPIWQYTRRARIAQSSALPTESAKKHKISEEVTEEAKSSDEVPEKKVKEMMQLVPIEEVYVESLQVKHPIIDWKNFMHALVEWKLYDSCGVHHVTSKDKEIFMLVEKDYPLRKGLALVMISYKLQGRIVGNKMHKAFPLPVIEFPLTEELPTASEESCHCQKKSEATAVKIALLSKVKKKLSVKVK